MGHICSRSLCSWACFLEMFNLNLALLHIVRISGFWESPGILVQFFSLGSQRFFPLRAGLSWAELLFSLFRKAQNFPTHGLGSLSTDFLLNLGLALSLKAQMALRYQHFCIVLGFDTILWYFEHQQLTAQRRSRSQRSGDHTIGISSQSDGSMTGLQTITIGAISPMSRLPT